MIYCDEPRKYKARGQRWSHVFADDEASLTQFAKEFSLRRRHRDPYLHYDVTAEELPALLAVGVVMLTRRQSMEVMIRAHRKDLGL